MRTRLRKSPAAAPKTPRPDLTMPPDKAEDYAREVSSRIVQARKELHLTQVELAELIDVSHRSMQGYENAEVIPYRKMTGLARVLNVPVEWLLHGDTAVTSTEKTLQELRGQNAELLRLVKKIDRKLK